MATAKVIIKGEDKLQGPLNQSKKQLDAFSKDVQNIGKKIESAFTITAVISAIVKLTGALKDCVAEYAEAEKVTMRLEAVWRNVGSVTGKTTKDIDKYAESIEKTTYFTKEAVQESAILLASTKQLTDEGFDRALDASVDLAAALGEDVTAAASTLAKALEDPASALNKLKSVGITFTEEEKKQIKALTEANQMYEAQSLILDKIEDRYKDVAKAINNTPAGKLENIKDVLSDIRKNLGQALLDSISPALDTLYTKLLQISNWIAENTDSKANEIKNKIVSAAKKGGISSLDLSGYTVNDLLKAYDSAKYNYENPVKIFGQDTWALSHYTFMNVQHAVQQELEKRGYEGGVTGARANQYGPTSTNEIVDSITEAMAGITDFIDKYGNASESYIKASYQNIIDQSQSFLDIIDAYTTKFDENGLPEMMSRGIKEALGLPDGTKPSDIIALYVQLQEVVETYTGKLDDLNKTYERGAANFEAFSIKFDPLGMNNAFGGLNGISGPFGTLPNGLSFTDTISLLAGGDNLTGSDILELDKLFKKYADLSESYQIQLMEDNIDRLSELIATYVDEDSPMATYMSEILENLQQQLAQAKATQKGSSSGSSSGGSGLGTTIHNIGEAIETLKKGAGAVFDDLKSQAGEAGDLISRLTSNMTQFGPLLGAIITALHYIVEGLMQEIKDILNEFVQWGLEPLRELGRMIGQIITPIFEEIMPSVIASGKVLMNLFQSIARLLTPIVEILMKVIGPVLTVLADIIVSIVGTISWAIDWIAYAITWVLNKISFGGIEQTSRPAALSEYVSSMMADPTEGYAGVSSTTGVNAAYSGVTNIYMNIYQNGTVVGEDGISQFAAIIRDELADLSYYSR